MMCPGGWRTSLILRRRLHIRVRETGELRLQETAERARAALGQRGCKGGCMLAAPWVISTLMAGCGGAASVGGAGGRAGVVPSAAGTTGETSSAGTTQFARSVDAFPVYDQNGRAYDPPFLGGFNVIERRLRRSRRRVRQRRPEPPRPRRARGCARCGATTEGDQALTARRPVGFA